MTLSSSLSSQEIEHLSNLLLSNDDSNLDIAFQILSVHPDSIATLRKELVLVANLSRAQEHSKQAAQLLEQEFDGVQLQYWNEAFKLFKIYRELYDIEEFEANWHWFEKHEKQRPEYMELLLKKHAYMREYFAIAEVLVAFYRKRLDWAEHYYLVALSHAPNDVQILNRLASLERSLHQDYERILAYYERILQLDPQHYDTIESNILFHLDYLKDPETAIELTNQALVFYPDDENFLLWLADASMLLDKNESFLKGKQLIQEILHNNPYNASAWAIYGNHLWLSEGNAKKAEEVYRQALVHNPTSYNILGNLAELLETVHKDYTGADELYVKAFAIYLDDTFHLGNFVRLLVVELGDFERAKDYYWHLRSLFFKGVTRHVEWNEEQWSNFQKAEQVLWQHYPELGLPSAL
ncbi:MAG: tetratricopeptide repeat protein [Aureispira sp.]